MYRRRTFLASSAAALLSCGRRKAEGFPGYAFVANRAGRAVAVVDLGAFAVARHIRLESGPSEVLSHPTSPAVYALASDTGAVHHIDTDTLALRRSLRLPGKPILMRLAPGGQSLWILSTEPPRLLRVSLAGLRAEEHVGLPNIPGDFDLSPDGMQAGVSFPHSGEVCVIDLQKGAVVRMAKPCTSAGFLRYRSDGRHLLVGDPEEWMLSIVDVATGRLVVRLPLAVRPENLCFGGGGGQLFITGEGMDAVVAVYPYQTQVGATFLAGRTPGYVAAFGDYLFVTNPDSGDVTILDIQSQRVIAVAAVGSEPCFVTFTPDGRYALVLNRQSGDMAVIRVATLSGRRGRFAPLFTMIPVGSEPVSAAVRAV